MFCGKLSIVKIKFLGAAGTVTGSCYLLTSESGQSIMIDCGLFQGTADIEKLNDSPLDGDCPRISALVLTHAHLDHCGRLPRLLLQGFTGQIWVTPPTSDIAELSLLDSAKINKEDKGSSVLYDEEQVQQIIEKFKVIDYEREFTIDNFSIILRDAGHILGSASLEITDLMVKSGPKKVVFSGDLGNSPEDLIRATELIDSADVVVMESTYGASVHPTGDPSAILQSEMNAVEASGGTLLIPAFSIERSQELLHRIAHLKKEGRVRGNTPVFFDSPMAEKVTEVFEKYHQYFNRELAGDFFHEDPFRFEGLMNVETKNDSQLIEATSGPKVIIAGSGMMTGGRVLHHALRYLPLSSTRLLFVGYQAEGTLGQAILGGQKSVFIKNVPVEIKATIGQTQAMSSHADQPRLLGWLKNIKGVQKVFLTHGENGPRTTLAEKIKLELPTPEVSLPVLNQEVSLDNLVNRQL
jgi:metallo-beta-lactamase family protein